MTPLKSPVTAKRACGVSTRMSEVPSLPNASWSRKKKRVVCLLFCLPRGVRVSFETLCTRLVCTYKVTLADNCVRGKSPSMLRKLYDRDDREYRSESGHGIIINNRLTRVYIVVVNIK